MFLIAWFRFEFFIFVSNNKLSYINCWSKVFDQDFAEFLIVIWIKNLRFFQFQCYLTIYYNNISIIGGATNRSNLVSWKFSDIQSFNFNFKIRIIPEHLLSSIFFFRTRQLHLNLFIVMYDLWLSNSSVRCHVELELDLDRNYSELVRGRTVQQFF